MKQYLSTIIIAALLPLSGQAQNSNDNYQKFRQGMLSGYQNFRKKVLDDYASYLDQVWKDYKAFKGEARDDTPKPKAVPDVKTTPVATPKDDKPTVEPVAQDPKVSKVPEAPSVPTAPGVPKPTTPQDNGTSFDFYGIEIKAPVLNCISINEMQSETVANAWRAYSSNGMTKNSTILKQNAQALGLNDWFTYEMVRDAVNKENVSANANSRIVLQHFLLANMGYDVRLANCSGNAALLFAIKEQVYARNYAEIDGKKYYIYLADGKDAPGNSTFKTCSLPKDADLGNTMSVTFRRPVNISGGKTHTCKLTYNDINVNADVDASLMEMLRYYPQMDIRYYAMSNLEPSMRKSVLEQIRPSTQGLSKTDAANKLLHFVQHAFDYATDGQLHGYEKPYFFEENFYYPKNDCEDRAIFYAFLVRNLLGLDVQLVQYPGHECTAVCFDTDVRGDGYIYNGKSYIICDPTYIGANIGQCMPDFRDVEPKVEEW